MNKKNSIANKFMRAVVLNLGILLILGFLVLSFFAVKHTQMFPVLYLNESRKTEIIDFSKMLLDNFKQDIALHKDWPVDRYINLGHEDNLNIIKEMKRFCDYNGFFFIRVSVDENLVLYRHHIFLRYVTDYIYRSDMSEITTKTYNR